MVDIALAALVALVGVAFALPDPLACTLAVALSAPLAVRRTHPVLALLSGTVAAVAQLFLLDGVVASVVAVPILVYSLARWSPRPLALTALGIGLAGAALGPVWWARSGLPATIAAHASVIVVAYVVGERGRFLAEQAIAGERDQIAREVHDIVAHTLSTIVVQAEGGRAMAARKPERAAEVLDVIARSGREALNEMRDLVALLRHGGGYRPAPGLSDLDELVARTGDRARLQVDGSTPEVSPMLGLTAYRVVQESVTNFLRHAGPSATLDIVVAFTGLSIEITARDDGRGGTVNGGHGLTAMRERVHMHGGTVEAGPREEGGFSVHVLLPTGGPT